MTAVRFESHDLASMTTRFLIAHLEAIEAERKATSNLVVQQACDLRHVEVEHEIARRNAGIVAAQDALEQQVEQRTVARIVDWLRSGSTGAAPGWGGLLSDLASQVELGAWRSR